MSIVAEFEYYVLLVNAFFITLKDPLHLARQLIIYLVIGISDEDKEESLEAEPSAVEELPHVGCGHYVVFAQIIG